MSSVVKSKQSNPVASVVTIFSQVPEDAMTAGILGTERSGNGIRIRSGGLIVTVSYLTLEAEQIWIISQDGQGSPAYVVASDFDSGLSLLQTTVQIGEHYLEPGSSDELSIGDLLSVYVGGGPPALQSELVAKQEFAGRWEYLLDEALYVVPACENWAGSALLNQKGQVCGVGSLLLEIPTNQQEICQGNLFVPLDLVTPYIDEMCTHGKRKKPARPWMGVLIQEYDSKLIVVSAYQNCPANLAGVKPGDVVVSINNEPVTSLSELLRKVWSLGSAGVEIPLTVINKGKLCNYRLQSVDRASFYTKRSGSIIN